MRPVKGTHLLFLEEQGVLFHESAQKLYHLNTVVTFVWCLFEEAKEREVIVSELSSTFGLTESEAQEYLVQGEKLLQDLGVLEGYEQCHDEDPGEQSESVLRIEYDDNCFVSEHRYRLLSSCIQIRYSRVEQVEWIDPVLSHLRCNLSSAPTKILDVVEKDDGSIYFSQNGEVLLVCNEYNQLAPMAKGLVWQTAIRQHDFFLDIHAGVVSDGKRCFLFPAAPGSGKSTLIAALIQNGFQFYSDEVALLHEDSLQVEPVPLAICVKDTGVEVLSAFYPELLSLPLHHRGDGKLVRYMPPPVSSVPAAGRLRSVGAVIFPSYTPNAVTRLQKLEKMTALESMMRECLIVDARLDLERVTALVDWVDKTPCYTLHVSDLDAAVALVSELSDSDGGV